MYVCVYGLKTSETCAHLALSARFALLSCPLGVSSWVRTLTLHSTHACRNIPPPRRSSSAEPPRPSACPPSCDDYSSQALPPPDRNRWRLAPSSDNCAYFRPPLERCGESAFLGPPRFTPLQHTRPLRPPSQLLLVFAGPALNTAAGLLRPPT